MSRFVAFALAIGAVSCASPSPSAPITIPPPTASPVAEVIQPTSPAPPGTEEPVPSPSPLSADVVAILGNPNNYLQLAPLPADHTVLVGSETAIATVRRTYNVSGPVVYLGHGLHREPVWVVIAKVQDMAPVPVGPGCPSPPAGCYQHWAVSDDVVALISDQTGQEAGGGFTTLREVWPSPAIRAD